MRRSIVTLVALCALTSIASAESTGGLAGRVLDSKYGTPVESATILVAGPNGVEYTFTSDAEGKFFEPVAPGDYIVVFIYGTSRSSSRVSVAADRMASVTGKLDSTEGEVIVIREKLRPPVPAKPQQHQKAKAPPYSNRAIVEDAWTRAFLLLDIDETGKLVRLKWLKRPGYDLEKIALSEVRKVKFSPARDSGGRAIRSLLVWDIEWPSAWWLDKFMGTRAGLASPERPRGAVIPNFSILDQPRPMPAQHLSVPCKGSGPWNADSRHKGYRDCSRADLRVAAREAWLAP